MTAMLMFSRGPSGVGSPEITDGQRRSADTVKFGIIKEVRYTNPPAVRVTIGDESDENGHLETGWLPMAGGRARGDTEWHPLEVGERVVVLSESGEVQNGLVIPAGLYTDEDPAPGDKAGVWRKKFKDGAVIEYDRESGAFKIDAKKGITFKVGGVEMKISESGIAVTGGAITHDGHAIDKTHLHKDTQPGDGLSGPPR